MSIKELFVPVLAGLGLIGLVVLLALDRDVSVLLPIETALLGLVLGLKKDMVGSVVGKVLGVLHK